MDENKNKTRGLGKGLSELLGEARAKAAKVPSSKDEVVDQEIDQIKSDDSIDNKQDNSISEAGIVPVSDIITQQIQDSENIDITDDISSEHDEINLALADEIEALSTQKQDISGDPISDKIDLKENISNFS